MVLPSSNNPKDKDIHPVGECDVCADPLPFEPDTSYHSSDAFNVEIEHPSHYNWFDIECMDVAQHFSFHRGNALKYIWRAGRKAGVSAADDLKKAMYCLKQELELLEQEGVDL